MEIVLEFMKLEKVEFGGIKGKLLSQQVVQLYEEFQEQYGVFINKIYDCLDLGSNVRVYYFSMVDLRFCRLKVMDNVIGFCCLYCRSFQMIIRFFWIRLVILIEDWLLLFVKDLMIVQVWNQYLRYVMFYSKRGFNMVLVF